MPLDKQDNDFFKQIEKELWDKKYEKLKQLQNKITTTIEKIESLPLETENASYLKKEILPHLKNDYYKTYLELQKHEKPKNTNT
jgi:hypothetical protein